MRRVKKEIDMNAHIENLKYEIIMENGNAVANISFTNLGYGDITAIKFNACGYNSFGDVVPVREKDKFFLVIQDIIIRKNQSVTNLKAKLPNPDMKKLDLEESQICYGDGSVISYEGNNRCIFELEEFDDQEQLSALHKLYDQNAKYRIREYEQGWICSCGRFNEHEKEECSLCGKNKIYTAQICSEDGLQKLVEDYKISEEKDREAREAEKKRKEKEAKKRNAIIGIAVIICIILIVPIQHGLKMGQRTTFDSEEEMKQAIQGTYTYYSESGSATRQLIISGDTCTKIWKDIDTIEMEITEWNPKEGTFHVLDDIIVTKDGDLIMGDELYEKGGYMSMKSSSSSSSSSYESGYSVLDITDLSWNNNSTYNVLTGKVKNTGNKTYYFVTVKGSFKDSSGNVLDTDSTYAVGSEGLAPGESSSFRLSVDRDYSISDCSVQVLNYDN